MTVSTDTLDRRCVKLNLRVVLEIKLIASDRLHFTHVTLSYIVLAISSRLRKISKVCVLTGKTL